MSKIITIDIAHPPLTQSEADAMLEESFRKIRLSSGIRIMKIIHGYGSTGKGGILKTTVRNWAYQHRNQIRSCIDGENLSPFNSDVQKLVGECQIQATEDLGSANNGVTVIWVR